MRTSRKIAALLGVIALVVVGISAFSLYKASQAVPEFYQEAIAVEPERQQDARDEFVAQATALASDLHHPGRWQSLFTEEQINAWLALELATNYPDLLPTELYEPRVSIDAKEATIACRYDTGEMSTVLSLTVDVYLHEPNVVALRIRKARAGKLPVPLGQVLDHVSYAAQQLNLRLEWRKVQGDPVALVTLPQPRERGAEAVQLHAIELRAGELFVSGTIGTPSESSPPIKMGPVASKPPLSAQPGPDSAETKTLQK